LHAQRFLRAHMVVLPAIAIEPGLRFFSRRVPRPQRPFQRANSKSFLRRKNFERSGDPPAVPRQLGDWAEESRLPMLLTVCIEAGRLTLTHTSWTGLTLGSRKWMSGQAAALAAKKDRTPFANLTVALPLRELTLPSEGRPPSPLDFYLSWMSPYFPIQAVLWLEWGTSRSKR